MAFLLPPTNNSLNQEQRTRLLRSTRKLEALLGATPHLLDDDDDSEPSYCISKSKLSKRHAIIRPLYAQNSSNSSLDATEQEYVLIRHPPRSPSPSSSRSASPPHRLKVSVTRESMSLPVAVEPAVAAAANKKTKGPQPLSQPLLLRLRALPVDKKLKPSVSVAVSPTVKPVPLPLTPAERRRLKVDSVIGPLSPINQSHSRSYSITDLRSPISPTATSSGEISQQGLTDREKRWKMAKLQRTLGENVPLELVFGRPKTDKKTRRRSRSVAYTRPGVMDLFAEDTTKPTQASTASSTPSSSSSTTPPIPKDRKHRQHRPRSLTLGSASALVAADIKLAEQHDRQLHHARGVGGGRPTAGLNRAKSAAAVKKRDGGIKPKDTRGTVSMDEGIRRDHQSSDVNEEWRRKEKEWSGEWNVRDMQEVAKALRGLKAR